jgi:hypothetical protein
MVEALTPETKLKKVMTSGTSRAMKRVIHSKLKLSPRWLS